MLVLVLYSCDILCGEDVSSVQLGTNICAPCFSSSTTSEEYCSMKGEYMKNIAETLSARKEYTLTVNKVSRMKEAIYGLV